MAVVCKSNAVVDPRTVVVHFEHAAITCWAVVCAWWFVIVACLAKSWRMCGFLDFDKGLLSRNLCCLLVVRFCSNTTRHYPSTRHWSWIGFTGKEIINQCHQHKKVQRHQDEYGVYVCSTKKRPYNKNLWWVSDEEDGDSYRCHCKRSFCLFPKTGHF